MMESNTRREESFNDANLQFLGPFFCSLPVKAEEIGKAGGKFIEENPRMEFMYDYMFRQLNEHAKLLRFKPVVPQGAMELCFESMACNVGEHHKNFMMESLVIAPCNRMPCSLASPLGPQELQQMLEKRA